MDEIYLLIEFDDDDDKTHLRYPSLHQKHFEIHRRGAFRGRTAPDPVLGHVDPGAEVVVDEEDGFGSAGEVGGYLEVEPDGGEGG